MRIGDIGDLVVLTLRDPAQALRVLRGLDLDLAARWMLLVLSVTLSTLIAGVAEMAFPLPAGDPFAPVLGVPITLAAIQFGALTLSAALVTVIGRAFGGQGTFADAILVIGWVELILVGLQAMQLVLMLVIPSTGQMTALVAFGLSLYLTIAFTKALHGFTSTAKVALGFVGCVLVLGFILSIVASMFGILPEVMT